MATIEELEKRLHDLERTYAGALPKLAVRTNAIEQRIMVIPEVAHLKALHERVEELERRKAVREDETSEEIDRRCRWHATYNAALTGLMPLLGLERYPWEESGPFSMLSLESLACTSADRAHGPLEFDQFVVAKIADPDDHSSPKSGSTQPLAPGCCGSVVTSSQRGSS